MKQARLSWSDETPISQSFDEGYFTIYGGLQESRHVFIKGNNLPNAWEGRDIFTIGECGFGTGLNFLATLEEFERSNKRPKELYFISVEKEPLSVEDLKKALSFFPNLKPFSLKLLEKYPDRVEGMHLLDFDNVKLLLCFGDIKKVLKNLTCGIDAWYLDGFSPSKNPDMWDMDTIRCIKNLSKPQTTLATYSVAKVVRENLTNVGFSWEKRGGYGKKRDMLVASFQGVNEKRNKPWFALPNPTKSKHAIVLGAGIAGSSIAYLLAKRGWRVDVLDKAKKPGCGASGNHCGVVAPLITKPDVDLGRFYQNAFLSALRWYEKLAQNDGGFFGVKHYAHDKTYKQRWDIWSGIENELFSCEKDEIGEYFEIKKGGYVQPYKLCHKLINSSKNISFHPLCEVKDYIYKDENYHVRTTKGDSFDAPVLIVALGNESEDILPNCSFSLQKIRGQVTLFDKTTSTTEPQCAKGYVCPFIDGLQLIGATYYKNDNETNARDEDNVQNLKNVEEFFPSATKVGDRVSFRCSSNDRFPIIGAVPNEEFYKNEYKALPWQKRKPTLFKPAVYEKNLYVSTAHGSRGLISAILGANVIASMCDGVPIPLEGDLLHAIHPARFLIRRLQKQDVW